MSSSESVETPQNIDEAQPPQESVQESGPESAIDTASPAHAEEHEHNHDHTHEHGPTLNPECTRQIDVEVAAETVSRVFAKVVKRYQRNANIPGFRAGKVPEAVIRRKFAQGVRQDVLETLLPAQFRAAIEKEGIQPVSQPQVTSLHLADGEPMRFQAAFEILPPIDITGYDEVQISRVHAALTDDEFEAELNRIRESHSTMEPVEEDRPLADGDYAQIRYTGLIQPAAEVEAAAKPIVSEDSMVEVGGANTMEAFTSALRGARPGQEMQIEVTYPEDFAERSLAGRTVAYDVEVKGIRRKNLPELNDEFARQMGEYETMDVFREKLRDHMAGDKRRRAEAEAKDGMVGGFVERFQFPVPESLLQQQIDARLDRGLRALAGQGMTTEQMRRLDFGRLRAAQRDAALNEVKGSLILDRLADVENVQVTDEEAEAQLQLLAYQAREPLDTLRKRLTDDGGLARIREQLRREKTADRIYEKLAV